MRNALGLATLLFLFAAVAQADDSSPVGLWKTLDPDSGKPRSLVRITESNGEFTGIVEKILPIEGRPDNPVCDKCEGDLKGKPVVGMKLLSNMKKGGEGYAGGHIVNPEDGKVYKAKMSLIEGGQKLEVRGFLGFSLLGKTRVWTREP